MTLSHIYVVGRNSHAFLPVNFYDFSSHKYSKIISGDGTRKRKRISSQLNLLDIYIFSQKQI